MFHLVYRSFASGYVTPQMIDGILEVARGRNAASQVTGLLVSRAGHFIQLLEGEETVVRETFERISKDRRHASIQKLLEFSDSERIFPSWSMGYITDENEGARLSAALEETIVDFGASSASHRERVITLLRGFNRRVSAAI